MPGKHVPWPSHEDRRAALQRRLIQLDRELHYSLYVAALGLTEEIEMIASLGEARGDIGWHVHRPPRHAWEGGDLEAWGCCTDIPTGWPPCCPPLDPEWSGPGFSFASYMP